MTCKQHYKQNL